MANKDNGEAAAKRSTAHKPQNAGSGARLILLAQYVKDLSFESPHGASVSQSLGLGPQLECDVTVDVTPQAGAVCELALNLEIHARNERSIIYHIELTYGGLFRFDNFPQNLVQPVIAADGPKILFPDLRRVLADVTRNAGFPPLMLDFGRLHLTPKAASGEPLKAKSRPNKRAPTRG